MTRRDWSRSARTSSRSEWAPSARNPPSRLRSGSSCASMLPSMDSRCSGKAFRSSSACPNSSGSMTLSRKAATPRAASKPCRMLPRSRGPPRSSARRDRARGISGTCFSPDRSSPQSDGSSSRKEMESRRRLMRSGSVSGDISRSASRRAPPPVTVRSIAFRRVPSRAPDNVLVSSRLPRVAGSMNSVEAPLSRSGRPSGGRSAIWVFST